MAVLGFVEALSSLNTARRRAREEKSEVEMQLHKPIREMETARASFNHGQRCRMHLQRRLRSHLRDHRPGHGHPYGTSRSSSSSPLPSRAGSLCPDGGRWHTRTPPLQWDCEDTGHCFLRGATPRPRSSHRMLQASLAGGWQGNMYPVDKHRVFVCGPLFVQRAKHVRRVLCIRAFAPLRPPPPPPLQHPSPHRS